MSNVMERVADGVAILDEMNPGWYEGVDLEGLRMELDEGCILGQVYGSYDRGVRVLTGREAGTSSWDQDHGFAQCVIDEPWEVLQAEWTRVVSARQQAAMPDVLMAEDLALD